MKDPAASMYTGDPGNPDRTGSPLWSDEDSYLRAFDAGGVHTNSGVGNKFAYLIVDGAFFNGQTVAPLEATRTASISKASWIVSQAAKTPALRARTTSRSAARCRPPAPRWWGRPRPLWAPAP